MSPLPRILVTTLFLVLVALVALLAVPALSQRTEPAARHAPADPAATAPAARAMFFSQRAALPLAIAAVVLTLAVLVSVVRAAAQPDGSNPPLNVARQEIGALAHLAANSVAQDAALAHERDVRRRAEEDARLKQQLLAQSVDEKIRLGHDLHDGIIQSLYALGLKLETVRALVQSKPAEAQAQLEQMRAAMNNTIRDVRDYISGLTPDALRKASFARAIHLQLNELGAGRDAEFDLQIDEEASALLTAEQSVEALQIAREAVSNALRHGSASRITVRMEKSDTELSLLVQDNGQGFEAGKGGRDGGYGLGNMRARAARIGAELRIESRPGEGARVVTTLPITRASIA